jgi:hypothetical protein
MVTYCGLGLAVGFVLGDMWWLVVVLAKLQG